MTVTVKREDYEALQRSYQDATLATAAARRAIRWSTVATAIAGLGLVVAVFGFLDYINKRDADERDRAEQSCERSASVREDNRAMWLYLVNENPDNPDVPEFLAELDKRLPSLKCVDNIPVPVASEPSTGG